MKHLTQEEMVLMGAGRCGGAWASIAVEATMGAAGAFIGFGVTGGNPGGAFFGAKAGVFIGGLICRIC